MELLVSILFTLIVMAAILYACARASKEAPNTPGSILVDENTNMEDLIKAVTKKHRLWN